VVRGEKAAVILVFGQSFYTSKYFTKEENMTTKSKIAQKRRLLPQVAKQIRNPSKDCLQHRGLRSQFYEYKRISPEGDGTV
jgi:hypothetical protein